VARNIPSPIALRAFEAAARHLSFTRAAEELNVTQAAISHQVKHLEGELNVLLFRRLTRKLLLTQEGQTLYAVVNEAFVRTEEVVEQLKSGKGNQALNVSLTPYFSAKWLTVRLSRFWAKHPDIDLRLRHSSRPGQSGQEDADLSITWGLDDWPHLDYKPLITARVVPVCSPRLLEDKPLDTIDDLYNHTLLHESDYSLWTRWLKRVGVDHVDLKRGSTMDDSNVIMQAAIDGQGIALGSDVLCAAELESGQLVMPFDADLCMHYSYYVVYRPGALDRPKIRAFYQWMLDEVEMDRQVPITILKARI
jgi:LysR family glycine cleavage system transcriptional activator